LQIATWEIVREDSGTLDVLGGDIYFFTNGSTDPAGTVTLAQTYVQSINGSGPKLNNLIAFTNAGAQDLVTQVNSVPEPATSGLMGAGLLMAGFLMRRMKKRG